MSQVQYYHQKIESLLYESMPSTCPPFFTLLEKLEVDYLEDYPLNSKANIKSLLSFITLHLEATIYHLNNQDSKFLPIEINCSNQTSWNNTKVYLERAFQHLIRSLENKNDDFLNHVVNKWNEKVIDKLESFIDDLIYSTAQIHLLKEHFQVFDVDEQLDFINQIGKYADYSDFNLRLKYPLVDTFFKDVSEYLDFLLNKQTKAIATPDWKSMAVLKKIDKNKWSYELRYLSNNKFIGDDIKPFKATTVNVDTFNNGCAILAERLRIYLLTDDFTKVPNHPPAFGELTYK